MSTIRLGLIGYPTGHSLSPAIHSASLSQLGIDVRYDLFDVEYKNLELKLHAIKDAGYTGVNVTMPYKRAVMEYLDEITPSAQLAQSVNTIMFKDGRMVGDTTDGPGMLYPLTTNGIDISDAKIAVIGSGGAGAAVCLAAACTGARAISLLNRSGSGLTRAYELKHRITQDNSPLASAVIDVVGLDDERVAKETISDADIVLNCTPVGMAPSLRDQTPFPVGWIRARHVVMDAVYTPRQTLLLRAAQKAGARVFDGVSMLIAQALLAEEIWLGHRLPADVYHNVLDQSAYFSR